MKVQPAVTLLVASLLITTASGSRISCPNDRQCGDRTCKPSEFCQVLFRPCPPPTEHSSTDSPYCPPILSCQKIQCPMEKPPPTQLLCIQGYKVKMIKLPHCDYEIPSCIPEDCGND